MSRNNPRTRFSTSVSKVLYEKLDRIAEVTGTQKTALVDEALELLVQKYRGRVLASGGEGVSIFMAKTIAFCSHKGGVGKTTSAAAFADLLGRRDYKLLLIDADPQGNLSKRFGYHPKEYRGAVQLSAAVLNILSDDPKPLKDFVLATQNKNVDIIPNHDRHGHDEDASRGGHARHQCLQGAHPGARRPLRLHHLRLPSGRRQ